MATTVVAQTLQVAITTQITLNGNVRNTTNLLSIQNISEYDSRVMTIPSSEEVTIVNFASSVDAGTFIKGDMKYLQITNLDAVNYARIRVNRVSAYGFDIKLDPGKTFMMGNTEENAFEGSATFVSFGDADYVAAQAHSSPVDIEYVVAST